LNFEGEEREGDEVFGISVLLFLLFFAFCWESEMDGQDMLVPRIDEVVEE
jgi:hypothetical protein